MSLSVTPKKKVLYSIRENLKILGGQGIKNLLQDFIKYEASSSILLLIASTVALLWANSPWQESYFNLFTSHITLIVKNHQFATTLAHIINDGLMSFFFLLVTLEVKRELLKGELNSISKALLPIVAAVGGMIIPAIIYLFFASHDKTSMRGWAIPTATDIAFSLAILIALRSFVPKALKGFLTALAIIDDIGAIIIIAAFYSSNIDVFYLLAGLLCAFILLIFNKFSMTSLTPYLLIGFLLWFLILKSGVHSTIAGVVLGFFIPMRSREHSLPLERLEHNLNPWVSYLILPLFALANTGLSFSKVSFTSIIHPVTLGIFFGLFIGKQLGVFLSCWLANKLRLAELPGSITLYHLYGLSILCGIGFTMSLFIGDLAFKYQEAVFMDRVKLGVLSASFFSAVMGTLWLWGHAKFRKG